MASKTITQPVPTPALYLYLKADGLKAERITKAKAKAVANVLATSRVNRDALVAFIMSGEFTSGEALPASVIDRTDVRIDQHGDAGWRIPDDCLGRAPKSGDRDWASTAESVRLWIRRVFVDTGVLRIGQVAVVYECR